LHDNNYGTIENAERPAFDRKPAAQSHLVAALARAVEPTIARPY
jgi:hypothetical protein